MARKYDNLREELKKFKKQNPKLSKTALVEAFKRQIGDMPNYLTPTNETIERWLDG